MYYGLIIIAVIIFGGNFALNDVYRKMRGSSPKVSLQSALISSAAGLVVFMIMNGFKLEFTFFTLAMALLASVNSLLSTFCTFRALDTINLSLYSLFTMLGGMVLPFLQGILFYGEKMTAAKIVCFVLICIALLMTTEKGEKRGGTIYYVGIFVLNGMSGVISKWFTSAPFEKTSATGYSILSASATIVLSALLLYFFFRKKPAPPETPLSAGVCAVNGVSNRIANYLLLIALVHVDASVQYPMVTGGVIIVSTLICFFGKTKPSKKEIISVVLAFVATLALVVIPE